MTYEGACRIAHDTFQKMGRHGLTEILDLGDCWYFWSAHPEGDEVLFMGAKLHRAGGPQPIIIMKETGELLFQTDFVLRNHGERKLEGPMLKIPAQYARRE